MEVHPDREIKIYGRAVRLPVWLLVASAADEASMNQRDAVLRLADWAEAGTFQGSPAFRHGEMTLVTTADMHLYHDHVDREAGDALGFHPEVVVFLSKHRSESRTPSLTVHPIGNLGPAEFGGRPSTLVPAAPHLMTEALREVKREAAGLPYSVTFESTHHGPYLETPAFYIEAGSTEREWRDPRAAEALMRALLRVRPHRGPVAIGVGGGHYVPRVSDVALATGVLFGHIVSGHALPTLTDGMIDQIIARTPGASVVYFHRKAIEKPVLRDLEARFGSRGLRAVHEADLPPYNPQQSL